VKIESRMVFVFNKIPRFRDDNDATAKKMLMIGFNRVYSDEEKDTELIDKLITEKNKEAFLKLAVDGMKNVLRRNLTFTVSEESKRMTAQIMEESDQFVSFVADTISEDYDWKQFLDGKKTSDVYEEFRAWADAEGYQNPMVRKQFTDRCCKEAEATTRKSHGSRFYTFRVPTGCPEGA
jgi:putative DNA primase/helicase